MENISQNSYNNRLALMTTFLGALLSPVILAGCHVSPGYIYMGTIAGALAGYCIGRGVNYGKDMHQRKWSVKSEAEICDEILGKPYAGKLPPPAIDKGDWFSEKTIIEINRHLHSLSKSRDK